MVQWRTSGGYKGVKTHRFPDPEEKQVLQSKEQKKEHGQFSYAMEYGSVL